MTTRDDLAAAATLPGVTKITPYYRQSLTTGDGFVRLASRAREGNGFGWVDTWEVWLAVPQNVPAAEKWIEANLDALMGSLDTELIVQSGRPAELVLDDMATVNGLIIAGTREG